MHTARARCDSSNCCWVNQPVEFDHVTNLNGF